MSSIKGLSHFLDIKSTSHSIPAENVFSKIVFRLHGFKMMNPDALIAIDFPDWLEARGKMVAEAGNLLRIHGKLSDLKLFLKKAGVLQMLTEGGIAVSGIEQGCQAIKIAKVRRNTRINKLERLLKNKSLIKYSEVCLKPTNEQINLAKDLGVDPRLMAQVEKIQGAMIMEVKSSIKLSIPSISTSKLFDLYVKREVLDDEISQENIFSSYGLSLKSSFVPTW